jgi:hypothetical protein
VLLGCLVGTLRFAHPTKLMSAFTLPKSMINLFFNPELPLGLWNKKMPQRQRG